MIACALVVVSQNFNNSAIVYSAVAAFIDHPLEFVLQTLQLSDPTLDLRIGLSRTTMSNIWQNIGIALGLKGIFLVTTLMGAPTLWMAILADTGATVLVTATPSACCASRRASSKFKV